ncbi:MAG: histidine phosphatase family protein [Byssovorax sp.]
MIFAFVRHGRTAWNDAGRMQGRADVPLSDEGRAQARGWRLPPSLVSARIVSSPLARAHESASLLAGGAVDVDDALVEMDWGAWEGESMEALRARPGTAFADASARGLDFRPPRGESPRDVQARILAWMERNDSQAAPLIAVTHQGVIRAVLALATGWDMLGKAPVRLADDVAHLVEWRDGTVHDVEWNLPLVTGPLTRRRIG